MHLEQIKTLQQKVPPPPKAGPSPQITQTPLPDQLAQEKKLLRTPRTRKYVRLMKQVDTLSEKDQEIIETIQSMPLNNKMLGILAPCGLPGCIIHAIDKFGDIIAHYHSEDELNDDLRQGYQQFLEHSGCMSVEVYTHTFCIVYPDGTIKFTDRKEA